MNGIKKKAEGEKYGIDGIIKVIVSQFVGL